MRDFVAGPGRMITVSTSARWYFPRTFCFRIVMPVRAVFCLTCGCDSRHITRFGSSRALRDVACITAGAEVGSVAVGLERSQSAGIKRNGAADHRPAWRAQSQDRSPAMGEEPVRRHTAGRASLRWLGSRGERLRSRHRGWSSWRQNHQATTFRYSRND